MVMAMVMMVGGSGDGGDGGGVDNYGDDVTV